jgi:tetratricopeptide (TPR) repeat protein
MHDLLKQMGKEGVEFIDSDLGFELCQREGIESIVTGRVTKAGEMFAIDIKVLDVENKDLLISAISQGDGVDSILRTQIDELSDEISRGMGMSETRVGASQDSIAEWTTSSMEAYNYFLRGREEHQKFYYEDARKFYEKAIELDPDFAFAYAGLAYALWNLRYTEEGEVALEKAMALREKATEKERLRIEASYAGSIEGNSEKQIRIIEEMARKYPKEKWAHYQLGRYYASRDWDRALEEYNIALRLDPNYGHALNDLGYSYANTEDFEKALEYFERYAASSPGYANPIDSIAELYFKVGDLDKAITKYMEVLDVKPDFYQTYWRISYVNALKEDYAEAVDWQNRFIDMAPSPGLKAQGFASKGFYNLWLGKFDQALLDAQEAKVLFEKTGDEIGKNNLNIWIGLLQFEKGKFGVAMEYLEIWEEFIIKFSQETPLWLQIVTDFFLGLTELNLGQLDSAKSRLSEMQAVLPKAKDNNRKIWCQFLSVVLKCEVMLVEGNFEECISFGEKELASYIPYQVIDSLDFNFPFLRDVLARAYQQYGEIQKAIVEYERLTTFDPDSRNRLLVHPKNYYRLAKLYEQQGDTAKAIENYEKFLGLWKDADPGIAEVEDARERLEGLNKFSK